MPSRAVSKIVVEEIREMKVVRVLLDEDLHSEDIKFSALLELHADSKIIPLKNESDKVRFLAKGNKILLKVGINKYLVDQIDIQPFEDNNPLDYKENKYRGIFRVKSDSSKLMLINVLDIEDYLKAVIHPEMGVASKPGDFEALKAFAVCMRNYTYMKLREAKDDFDIYPDKRDQIYSGIKAERVYTNQAIIETNHLVLLYNEELAKTFYFSACGGSTENCDNVFSQKKIGYLKGVRCGEEPFCSIAPGLYWEENYTSAELIKLLQSAKYIANTKYTIMLIEINSRFESGRVNELDIMLKSRDRKTKKIVLTGNQIRNVIKSKQTNGILRSTNFELEPEYKGRYLSGLKIKGKGNGHGVGFCQWGAIGQSRQGRKFDEILYFYFPNTSLREM
ncbi:MAG: SpoIID/LytB domain-containing protein [Ignavibacteria bacterium]